MNYFKNLAKAIIGEPTQKITVESLPLISLRDGDRINVATFWVIDYKGGTMRIRKDEYNCGAYTINSGSNALIENLYDEKIDICKSILDQIKAINLKTVDRRNLLYGTLAGVEEYIEEIYKYPFLKVSEPFASKASGRLQRSLIVDIVTMEEYINSLAPVKKTRLAKK
jgi:hypothetical protein